MEREAERILDNTGDLAETWSMARPGVDAFRRIEQQKETERTETEPQRAILPAPDGLSGVLGSGAFTVTGTVAFSPVRPFNPAPDADAYRGETALVAQMDIDYQYPTYAR